MNGWWAGVVVVVGGAGEAVSESQVQEALHPDFGKIVEGEPPLVVHIHLKHGRGKRAGCNVAGALKHGSVTERDTRSVDSLVVEHCHFLTSPQFDLRHLKDLVERSSFILRRRPVPFGN